MEFYNKLYILKKEEVDSKSKYSLFLKSSGFEFAGQFANPDIFYSIAVLAKGYVVLFDPVGFEDELEHTCQLLGSLQDFTDCKIVLMNDLPNNFEVPFSVVKSNDKITDLKIKISDALLRIIKEQKEDPNNDKYKMYNAVQNLLVNLGFKNSELGFNYICDCVYYIINEDRANIKLVGDVYKHVARINNTLDYKVERNIRYAINRAVQNCDHKHLMSNEHLRYFDKLMFDATAKTLILAIVGVVKYNVAFL